jgi:O-antigen/teichoic acid export membrane protein
MLGPDGRGVYVVPGIIASLIATVFGGLTTTVASSMLKDRRGAGALRAGLIAAIPLVVFGAVAAFGSALLMHAPWAAAFAIAALPFMAMSALVNGFGYGVGNVRAVVAFTLATSAATVVLLGAGFIFAGRSTAVAIAMWLTANVVVAVIGIVVVLWKARKLPSEPVAPWPFLTYALRVGATGLVSMLNYRIDLYIVAYFVSRADLGIYATAVSAAEVLMVAAQVGSIVSVPHIGSLSPEEAANFTAKCVRNNLIVVFCCAAAAALVAPYVIQLLFGNAFLPAVAPFRVLLLGIVPMSSASIVSSYYTLNAKKPQIPLIIAGISTAICAVLSILLVPRIGIVGAAIGTAVSYTLTVLIGVGLFSMNSKVPIHRVLFLQMDDLRSYRRLAGSVLARPSV